MIPKWVAYYRVSTKRQSESGLGLDAQRDAVRRFVSTGILIAEFGETESGGRHDRPQLEAALRECRVHRAKLVIAKLDRLARSVAFISRLVEEGVDFCAVDMPHANSFTVNIMAAMAQFEREMISQRTVAALAAARARGVVLGGRRAGHRIEDESEKGRTKSIEVRSGLANRTARDRFEAIQSARRMGATTLHGIALRLNADAVPAPRGGSWSASQVKRVIDRCREASCAG